MTPFLKWPGGKRWLVKKHPEWLNRNGWNRLVEPFLGGGSAYFHLAPARSLIGDTNPDVIDTYIGVRDDPAGVQRHLRLHQRQHSSEYYYNVRAMRPRTPASCAARVIYLNRTCFNGVYRVNRKGEFNVPIGTKTAVVLPTDDFLALAARLRQSTIRLADFEDLVDDAGTGDLIFADPPYTVKHNLNGFVKYNEVMFSWADQVRLAESLAAARNRGAIILVTNAAHESICKLYRDHGFHLKPVERFSSIAATGTDRGKYSELLISCQSLPNNNIAI